MRNGGEKVFMSITTTEGETNTGAAGRVSGTRLILQKIEETVESGEVVLTRPVNWNDITDPRDKDAFDRQTANFWLPERVPLSNDLKSWGLMSAEEKTMVVRVFAGLTLLDTIQGKVGVTSLIEDAVTLHEVAVYNAFAFMEEVHAKSYSSVFATLISTAENNEAFRFAEQDKHLRMKAAIVEHYYHGNILTGEGGAQDAEKKKIISVLLESFLFYSGFFAPLWYAGHGKLTDTADLIRLILRDEALHGYYIGQKFRDAYAAASVERQAELRDFTLEILQVLYENELEYTQMLYDPVGLTHKVKPFLRYNANKALMNLGFDPFFRAEDTVIDPIILTGLSTAVSDNHDFFSGGGSSYSMGSGSVSSADWGAMSLEDD